MKEKKIIINSPEVSEELVEFFKSINFQHWDNSDHTVTRDAKYGYTIVPGAIKNGDQPAPEEQDNREIIGWQFICLVPDDFVAPEGVSIEEI
jgi:hypothetical protein